MPLYCSECRDKILSWKASDFTKCANSTRISLHDSFMEFLACGDRCRFCAYILTFFQDHELQDLVQMSHNGYKPLVIVYVDPRRIDYLVGLQADSNGLTKSLLLQVVCWREGVHMDAEFFVCTSASEVFNRSIWSSPHPIDLQSRTKTVRGWLTECKTKHAKCQGTMDSNSPVAARILQVQRKRDKQLSIHLVSSCGLDLYHNEYLVLSHVWGSIRMECKTTTNNIARYQTEGIPYDSLPKTFQEATQLAAALEIQYIWIDSLCIVQDDPGDWQREAAKMAYTYHGATLTLSATSACDASKGCSLLNDLEPAVQFPSPDPSGLAFSVMPMGSEQINSLLKMHDALEHGPVQKRAWILQEQKLSQRILHAAYGRFLWTCASLSEPEHGPRPDRRAPTCSSYILDNHRTARNLDSRWWSWVKDYTTRRLTHPGDRYAALAGIVRLHQELSCDEPLIGLWRRKLHIHLAWTVEKTPLINPMPSDGHDPSTGPDERRPSWTWMTYPHNSIHIRGPTCIDHNPWATEMEYTAEILSTNVSWSGEPLTSIPTGTITLRAICDYEPVTFGTGTLGRGLPGASCGRRVSHDRLDPDCRDVEQKIELLTLYAYREAEWVSTRCLLIKATGNPEHNQYMRVGVTGRGFDVDPDDPTTFVPKGIWKTVTLV